MLVGSPRHVAGVIDEGPAPLTAESEVVAGARSGRPAGASCPVPIRQAAGAGCTGRRPNHEEPPAVLASPTVAHC
jgi:hypothetical protein